MQAKPIRTGTMFLLASSMGLTSQMAATGIRPQGTTQPPPIKMALICPSAARIGMEEPVAVPEGAGQGAGKRKAGEAGAVQTGQTADDELEKGRHIAV